jgi:hypothetical protein
VHRHGVARRRQQQRDLADAGGVAELAAQRGRPRADQGEHQVDAFDADRVAVLVHPLRGRPVHADLLGPPVRAADVDDDLILERLVDQRERMIEQPGLPEFAQPLGRPILHDEVAGVALGPEAIERGRRK